MQSISALGLLTPDPSVPEWLVSQPIPIPLLDGAPVAFVVEEDSLGEDRFEGETESAVNAFLSLDGTARAVAAERAFRNYREFLDATDIDELPISGPADVFSFADPTEIRVSRRRRRDEDVYITVACNCDWEEEHALQFVYRRGDNLVRVSAQDGHLTDADAYNRDDLEVDAFTAVVRPLDSIVRPQVQDSSRTRQKTALATALSGLALITVAFALSLTSVPILNAICTALPGIALLFLAARIAPGLGFRKTTPMDDPDRTLRREDRSR